MNKINGGLVSCKETSRIKYKKGKGEQRPRVMAAIEAGAASNIITKTNAHLDFQGPQLMQDLQQHSMQWSETVEVIGDNNSGVMSAFFK